MNTASTRQIAFGTISVHSPFRIPKVVHEMNASVVSANIPSDSPSDQRSRMIFHARGVKLGIVAPLWFLRKPGRMHPLENPPETAEDRIRQSKPDSTGPGDRG